MFAISHTHRLHLLLIGESLRVLVYMVCMRWKTGVDPGPSSSRYIMYLTANAETKKLGNSQGRALLENYLDWASGEDTDQQTQTSLGSQATPK